MADSTIQRRANELYKHLTKFRHQGRSFEHEVCLHFARLEHELGKVIPLEEPEELAKESAEKEPEPQKTQKPQSRRNPKTVRK